MPLDRHGAFGRAYESQDGNDMFSQLYNITNRLGNVD